MTEAEKPLTYLTELFESPERWVFESQVAFLTSKVDAVLRAKVTDTHFAVIERSIYEHFEIFVRAFASYGSLEARSVETFERLSRLWIDVLPPPLAIIACKCPPDVCVERLAARRRSTDPVYPPGHITRLGDLLCDWLNRFELAPVLTIDTVLNDIRSHEVYTGVAREIEKIAGSSPAEARYAFSTHRNS